MSHKGGKTSARLKINEHMTSVGEEILCVLEKRQRGADVCSVNFNVRVFVLERLSSAAEFVFKLFQREMETLEILLETKDKLLDAMLQPHKLHRADALHLPVCKDEVSLEEERSPSLVQEEPEPPHIKEEQEEKPLQRPEEVDRPMMTLLAVKSEGDDGENRDAEPVASTSTEHMITQADAEDCGTSQPTSDDQLLSPLSSSCSESEDVDRPMLTLLSVKSEGDDCENRDMEPVASTSTEHMKTQAYIEYWVPAKPTSDDQLLSSHCSESDITEDSDEWEPSVDQSPLNTLKSPKTQHVEGQRLSLSNKMSQDLKSSKETHSMQSHTEKKRVSCTVCDKLFNDKDKLKTHMRTHTGKMSFTCSVCNKDFNQGRYLKKHNMQYHTGEKPFTCTVCNRGFSQVTSLKRHMSTHTGENPFTCTVCGHGCIHKAHLKQHMRIHTGEKPFTCTVCNRGFSQLSSLKRHMRTHTGEKPFTCTVCGSRVPCTCDFF